MGIELTPEQEALAKQAIEAGHFASVEDFIQAAFYTLHTDLEHCAEDRLGLTTDEIRAEIRKGFESGEAEPWEGADVFKKRMRSIRSDDIDGDCR